MSRRAITRSSRQRELPLGTLVPLAPAGSRPSNVSQPFSLSPRKEQALRAALAELMGAEAEARDDRRGGDQGEADDR
jgi:hypothetical protein